MGAMKYSLLVSACPFKFESNVKPPASSDGVVVAPILWAGADTVRAAIGEHILSGAGIGWDVGPSQNLCRFHMAFFVRPSTMATSTSERGHCLILRRRKQTNYDSYHPHLLTRGKKTGEVENRWGLCSSDGCTCVCVVVVGACLSLSPLLSILLFTTRHSS